MLNPRGTDGSDRPKDSHGYRTEDYVVDHEELRQNLGLERMLLLGHSPGGVVAQAYATAYPGRVRKLVLASTLARFGPENEAAMRAGMDRRSKQPWYADALAALETEQAGEFRTDKDVSDLWLREAPLYFARYGPVEAGYLDTLRTETINADALRLFNEEIFTKFDLRPSLKQIKAQTLVITGDDDFICGPLCAEEISAGITASRMVIVGDSGHMVFV